MKKKNKDVFTIGDGKAAEKPSVMYCSLHLEA